MPRPERPVDAAEGPVQSFAADLRKLRAECGLTYRELANTAHFSKATLSSAAAGHRPPTWEVTCAYVRACGGKPEDWRERWQAAAAAAGLSADAARPAQGRNASDQSDDASAHIPGGRLSRLLTRRTALPVLAAVLVTGAAMTAIWAGGGAGPTTTELRTSASASAPTARFAGARQPVTDNGDPERTRCAFDPGVRTLDSVEINTAQENLLGFAELRYAPSCQVAWGRFVPSSRMTYLNKGATVSVTARRPATATTGVPYRVAFDGQAAFGNILRTQRGCVEVTVTIHAASGGGSGTTRCGR